MPSEYVSDYNDDVRAESCYFCARRHGLQTHHIAPQRFNGSDSAENLVIVCEECHKKLERLYDASFYERFGVEDHGKQRLTHLVCHDHQCSERAEVRATAHGEIGEPRVTYYCKPCADRRDNLTQVQQIVDADGGEADAE